MNAMTSALSFLSAIPAKAIALPGAKAAGLVSHLSRLASVHLTVALEDRAPE